MTELKINLNSLPIFLEVKIDEYKLFYKEHFQNFDFRKRVEILETIGRLQDRYKKIDPASISFQSIDVGALNLEADKIVARLLDQKIAAAFAKKDAPKSAAREQMPNNIWLALLIAFSAAIEGVGEKIKQEFIYKKNFLSFISDCLYEFGLHSNILLRSDANKRYNLEITHYYRSRVALKEQKHLLTHEQFQQQFFMPYSQKLPIKCVGKLIPFDKIAEVRITTTLLKNDELELFGKKNRFGWNDLEKDIDAFIDACLDETERYHPNPFELPAQSTQPDKWKMMQTIEMLTPFPKSQKLVEQVVTDFNNGIRQRHILDNLRLAIELVVKKLLNNTKSLENQLPELGKLQKVNNTSPELIQMFTKLLDGYTKYQNTYIKHDDAMQDHEIELMMDLSATYLRHLCSLKKTKS